MRAPIVLFGLLVLTLALTGCAPQGGVPAAQPTATPPQATAPSGGETPPAPTVTVSEAEVQAEAVTVTVTETAALGQFLADAQGQTLYLFLNDTPSTSTCYDQCAQNWPPLLAAAPPVAGAGVDAALLGTTQRQDGATQVTYNGWPLYYFARDAQPGDTNGQGVGDIWYVISPQGEKVEGE